MQTVDQPRITMSALNQRLLYIYFTGQRDTLCVFYEHIMSCYYSNISTEEQ